MDASNEQNRDESNVPRGASGTFGTGPEGENRTKQSTGIEQELTVNQSDAQQQAQQEDHPSYPFQILESSMMTDVTAPFLKEQATLNFQG